MDKQQISNATMRTGLGRHLADYAGSGLILGGFLLVALILCSAIGLVERVASAPASTPSQASAAR